MTSPAEMSRSDFLWGFHNASSGRCFPSYERIAEKADCARSTVYEAIRALEDAGILTWANRIARSASGGPTYSAGRRTGGASSARATPTRSSIRRRKRP